MYSVYVVNKTACTVLVRLHRDKFSTTNSTFKGVWPWKGDEAQENMNALVRCGFCVIPPNSPVPFPIDVRSEGPRKYASMCESWSGQNKLWVMDYEMNCMSNGCLVVNSKHSLSERAVYLNQGNPEPQWFATSTGKPLPAGNIVKADSQVCFGRISGVGPCSVSVTGDGKPGLWVSIEGNCKAPSGEILLSLGHEFVRAKAGDLVPPHAVIAGVAEPEGSLYVGRVGGNKPCSIISEDGKIKSFCYSEKKVQSGEILVLKNGSNM